MDVLSEEERRVQYQVDTVVAQVLFERDLDTLASYNVRTDGMVVIKFDESVPEAVYTETVQVLRSNKDIHSLRAEQSGKEVCPYK